MKAMNFVLCVCFLSIFAHAGESLVEDGIQRDVVYGKAGDVSLKLDIAVPPTGEGPFPLLVFIHGGAWREGNKASYHGSLRNWAKRGYVAASVMYRFCPQHKFPAQVEDVKGAVRFLRANAKAYKIDPARVGAIGHSAGGHLSLMLGLMDRADGLEGNSGNADQSSKVQAVVNYFGPTDFFTAGGNNPIALRLVGDFLGSTDQSQPAFKLASPVTYINKGDPPVLTFHGSVDPLVPVAQARTLHEALKKHGVTEQLEIIENGGHGFGPVETARAWKLTGEFFDKHLKAAPAAGAK